jgi:hypothetical protein
MDCVVSQPVPSPQGTSDLPQNLREFRDLAADWSVSTAEI